MCSPRRRCRARPLLGRALRRLDAPTLDDAARPRRTTVDALGAVRTCRRRWIRSRRTGSPTTLAFPGPAAALMARQPSARVSQRHRPHLDLVPRGTSSSDPPRRARTAFVRVVSVDDAGRRRALNHFNKRAKGLFTRACWAAAPNRDVDELRSMGAGARVSHSSSATRRRRAPADSSSSPDRPRTGPLVSCGVGPPGTRCKMIVDHARGLHERVHGGRPDEAISASAQFFAHRSRLGRRGWHLREGRGCDRPRPGCEAPEQFVDRQVEVESGPGVLDRRLDLAAVSNDALVAEEACDVVIGHDGDTFRVESMEDLSEGRTAPEDRDPQRPAWNPSRQTFSKRRTGSCWGVPHSSSW